MTRASMAAALWWRATETRWFPSYTKSFGSGVSRLSGVMSDPTRIKMLGTLAAAREGRGCCGLPNLGAPAEDGDGSVCVCEFVEVYGLGQSKVSYHLGKLKEAGLVKEEKRGRWSFYSLDSEAADSLFIEAAAYLGVSFEVDGRV